MPMAVLDAVGDSIGVDTPEDAVRVERILIANERTKEVAQ
jgi:hypothetical protein